MNKLIYLVVCLSIAFLVAGCTHQESIPTHNLSPTKTLAPANTSTPISTSVPSATPTLTSLESRPYSGTRVEYPGSSTKIYLPVSNQSLAPPPYPPYDRTPEPGADSVPLDTKISMSFPRPPALLKLEIEPEVRISHVDQELVSHYSGKYTFYLTKRLKPGTEYTITIMVGQNSPPGPGFAPTLTTSWNFTTIEPEIDLVPKDEFLTLRNNKTKLLLVNSSISYEFLDIGMCPSTIERWGVKTGDLGIEVNGTLKSEYEKDYWVCLNALAYNSTGALVGGTLDMGHICGSIPVHVDGGSAAYFKMHLNYREDIERIEINCGCVSEIPPP